MYTIARFVFILPDFLEPDLCYLDVLLPKVERIRLSEEEVSKRAWYFSAT
jgi:hypothetical protein